MFPAWDVLSFAYSPFSLTRLTSNEFSVPLNFLVAFRGHFFFSKLLQILSQQKVIFRKGENNG